jgi:hypothetical protein
MNEGWFGDDYLILFAESELGAVADRYAISRWLPRYELIGLSGWDDLIVKDDAGQTYSIPAVPIDPEYLEPFSIPKKGTILEYDHRFAGKIKWYVKPLVLGGSPTDKANIILINHTQHGQLVNYWNRVYWEIKNRGPS